MWRDVPRDQVERLRGPWFAAMEPWLDPLLAEPAFPTVARLSQIHGAALAALGAQLIVQHGKTRPRQVDELYEVRAARGELLTRENSWHDLFNALSWLAFPRSKRVLVARLAEAQRARWQDGLPGTRTPAHDRLAMLDEGGVVLANQRGFVFGHAILEHAVLGQTDVRCAVAELGDVTNSTLAGLDHALSQRLTVGEAITPGPGRVIEQSWFA